MDISPSSHLIEGNRAGGHSRTENARPPDNRTTSPSLGDEGDSQRAEQDAVNEVDGLIVGLDILDELEGDEHDSCYESDDGSYSEADDDSYSEADDESYSEAEDDSYSVQLQANQLVNLPPISPETCGESLHRLRDHEVWANLWVKYRTLFRRHPDKPPNFEAFLKKLQPSRCGRIKCRSCNGQRDDEFLPGSRSLIDHFRFCHLGNIQWADQTDSKDHVHKAMEDLMSAPQAKNIIYQLLTRCNEIPYDQNTWTSSYDDSKTRAQKPDKNRRAALYQDNKQMPQWAVLRELRKKFHAQHREFRQYAASEGASPTVSAFAKRCRRPRGLLRLGVNTFKRILRGRAPAKLLEVFAFVSLSYAMAAVMADRRVQVKFAPDVKDFFTWTQSIRRESGRRTFQEITAGWFLELDPSLSGWPSRESNAELAHYPVSEILDMLAEKHHQPDQRPQTSMKEVIIGLIKDGSANEAFNFSAFLHINRLPTTNQNGTQAPVLQDTTDSAGHHRRDTSDRNEEGVAKHDMAVRVRGTAIFIRAQLFMIYIAQFGLILIYFGNENRRCQLSIWSGPSPTVREIIEAAGEMKQTILDPLLSDENCPAKCKDFFAAMREVLDLGLILTIQDLRTYTFQAAWNDVNLSKVPLSWFLLLLKPEIEIGRPKTVNSTSAASNKRSGDAFSHPTPKRRRCVGDTEDQFQCYLCPKVYGSQDSLRRHKNGEHMKLRWACPGCNHSNPRLDNLKDHVKRKHPTIPLSSISRHEVRRVDRAQRSSQLVAVGNGLVRSSPQRE